MNTIYYICQWGNNRSKAWSGTNLALLNALKKKCKVIEVDVKQKLSTKVAGILYSHTKFVKYGFWYDDIRGFNPSKKIPSHNADILSFFEMNIPEKDRGYIYQDMCVDYIDKVVLKDEKLKNCFRKNVSHKVIKIRKEKQKEYYKNCSGIFVMGKWLKEYLIEHMGINEEKIYCVGAGYDVDINSFDPTKRTGNKLLFVGVDFERKAGPLVLEAFKILRQKYQNNAELYIVGPKKIELSKEYEGIHFIGNVSKDEISYYYNMCDSFCMPSYLEPFGKAFVEALAFGLPVIARKAFAASDFITDGENGFLIEDDNVFVLAEKMYESLNNNKVRENVLKDMSRIRDYYSWEKVAERINEVIKTNADN